MTSKITHTMLHIIGQVPAPLPLRVEQRSGQPYIEEMAGPAMTGHTTMHPELHGILVGVVMVMDQSLTIPISM